MYAIPEHELVRRKVDWQKIWEEQDAAVGPGLKRLAARDYPAPVKKANKTMQQQETKHRPLSDRQRNVLNFITKSKKPLLASEIAKGINQKVEYVVNAVRGLLARELIEAIPCSPNRKQAENSMFYRYSVKN